MTKSPDYLSNICPYPTYIGEMKINQSSFKIFQITLKIAKDKEIGQSGEMSSNLVTLAGG